MLRIENLSKTYDNGSWALADVSFEIQPGEFVAVLGESGSGKSTFLRCVNRLIEPSSGKIFFEGEDLVALEGRRLREARRKIGMIFQNYNLIPRAATLTNVLTGSLGSVSPLAGIFNRFPPATVERACRNLERMGLSDKLQQKAGTLSGGQQQRVGIARALMQNPKLLLADEPVSSLDPTASANIMGILREINSLDGVAVICNLHLPDLAKRYASRILALKAGRVIYDGPSAEFPDDLDLYGFSQNEG